LDEKQQNYFEVSAFRNREFTEKWNNTVFIVETPLYFIYVATGFNLVEILKCIKYLGYFEAKFV
jgi:hypothetical protein